VEVTKDEQRVINTLDRLSKRWPKSLWLFSANGTLCIMKKNEHGEQAETAHGCVDPEYLVTTIAIENDGGDW